MDVDETGAEKDGTMYSEAHVDITKAKAILLQAILWLKLHSLLINNTTTVTMNIRAFPFLQTNTDNIFMMIGDHSMYDDHDQHRKRLSNSLAVWNFKCVPVAEDGDCFFHAIAFGLKKLARSNSLHAQSILRQYDITTDNDTDKTVTNLRQAMVSEWIGPNY